MHRVGLQKKQYLKLALALVIIFSLIAPATFAAKNAEALSGSQFDAGRIIDDSVFFDRSAMSPQEIQNFLNAKLPSCDTNGTQAYGNTTRKAYAASKGVSTPFTCLKNYVQTIPYVASNEYCSGSISGGTKSSANIIYDVAQACGINPKVLLVLLQKEQSLITDDWPWPIQYRSATGYGCPDTAPCDAEYYGFFNQAYQAAKAFRRYQAKPSNYRAGRNNTVYYNPGPCQTWSEGVCTKYFGNKYNSEGKSIADITYCGSSSVFIQNQATAGLYTYTPYQPNQAALNNLYGTGDDCSAYGNRNFWRMFNDWFGSPSAPPFSWQIVTNNIYDEKKYSELDSSNLRKNERIFISLKVKNTGTEIWYKDGPNPAVLGTTRPYNHNSPLCDPSTWISCDRATKLREEAVYPGGEGHFEFYAVTPSNLGEIRDYLAPVLENRSWMSNDTGYHVYLKSNDTFSWGWGSYGAWSDPARTIPIDINNLSRGQYFYVTLWAKNTSASFWTNNGSNPVNLGTAGPLNRISILCSYVWVSCDRPTIMNEPIVPPGATASFNILVRAPYTVGEYREYFRPVSEYKAWMSENYNHIYLRVTN